MCVELTFIMVVDEMGGSMITLLPGCDTAGMCYVGEIEVQTDAGFVVPDPSVSYDSNSTRYEKTTVSIVLDITEDPIKQLINT